MAKYIVKMSCGHEVEVELYGKHEERERKIKYYEEYGMCKECYKNWMQEKNANKGLLFHAEVLREIDEKDGSLLVDVWFTDDTMPYKDQIKALGYKWTRRYESPYNMCWCKTIRFEDLSKEMEQAQEIGAVIVEDFDELIGSGNYALAVKLQKQQKKLFDEIAELEKPEEPEILQEFHKHKWNGTIYGKAGNYTVYLDGKKTSVTDEQEEEIKNYLNEKEEYNKKVKEIKNA